MEAMLHRYRPPSGAIHACMRMVYDRTAIATAPVYATSAQRAPAPSVAPAPRMHGGAGGTICGW